MESEAGKVRVEENDDRDFIAEALQSLIAHYNETLQETVRWTAIKRLTDAIDVVHHGFRPDERDLIPNFVDVGLETTEMHHALETYRDAAPEDDKRGVIVTEMLRSLGIT